MNSIDKKVYSNFMSRLSVYIDPKDRLNLSKMMAKAVNQTVGFDHSTLENQPELSNEGILNLGSIFSKTQAKEIEDYFLSKKCHPGHVVTSKNDEFLHIEETRKRSHFGSYSMKDIAGAPYLDNFFTSPEILNIVQNYLGCPPTLYSLNAWWSFSGHKEQAKVTHNFHRDPDDLKFCTLFLFLTDVDEYSGAQYYVKESHNYERFKDKFYKQCLNVGGFNSIAEIDQLFSDMYRYDGNAYDLSPVIEKYLFDDILTLKGEAGSAFITDSYGLHKGSNPTKRDRLAVWARFGFGANYGTHANRTDPIKIDNNSTYFNNPYLSRLIFRK